MEPTPTPLQKALKTGDRTQKEVAVLVGVSQQMVSEWERGRPPSARHCVKIEAALGISRHVLRPDIFGPAPVITPTERADLVRVVTSANAEVTQAIDEARQAAE